MEPIRFESRIENFNSNLWGHHFTVPEAVSQSLLAQEVRRVVCTLNDGAAEFQCALMPKGDGLYFININKKIRDKLKLKEGSFVQVALRPDESQYGLPMPEELQALLELDDEGNALFHALTPGKQRTLLYWVGTPKSADGRIGRALAVVEHLKTNGGKVNYKVLMGPKG